MTNPLDDLLRVQQSALGVRARRQEILASNIANAETPNYKARDVDFKSALQNALGTAGSAGSLPLTRTNAGHQAGMAGAVDPADLLYRTETQSSVDGNTVNMDIERAQFLQNTLMYEAGVTFVNHQLNGIKTAIQG